MLHPTQTTQHILLLLLFVACLKFGGRERRPVLCAERDVEERVCDFGVFSRELRDMLVYGKEVRTESERLTFDASAYVHGTRIPSG